jgi:hypothetical protein
MAAPIIWCVISLPVIYGDQAPRTLTQRAQRNAEKIGR